jgi:hypothetical protein
VANFGADKPTQIAQIKKISGGAGVVITAGIDTPADIAEFATIAETKVKVTSAATTFTVDFTVAEGNDITLSGNVGAVAAVNVDGKLTLSGNNTTLAATGDITIGSNGKLDITGTASGLVPTGDIIVRAGGELALAGSAVLTLADNKLELHGAAGNGGAKLTGAGSVVAGGTTITGGATGGEWHSVGDGTTIEITADNITGTGTGATLTGAANDSATIAVAAVSGSAAILTVDLAVIDISAKGTVTLAGNKDNGSKTATLKLKGHGSNAAALFLIAGGTQVATVANPGKLKIGGNNGTDKPAEININGTSITVAPSAVVVLVAETDGIATAATAVHKLGGGASVGSGDLWIVSSDDPTTSTTIVTGDKILSSN